MFAMILSLIWGEKFSAPANKKERRQAGFFEEVAGLLGVCDSRSVNEGCCVLFRFCMNRRFVCRMTFRQWLQDGWMESGRGGGGGVGSDHMSDV